MLAAPVVAESFSIFLRYLRERQGFGSWGAFAEEAGIGEATAHRIAAELPTGPFTTHANSRKTFARGLGRTDWFDLVKTWQEWESGIRVPGVDLMPPPPEGAPRSVDSMRLVIKQDAGEFAALTELAQLMREPVEQIARQLLRTAVRARLDELAGGGAGTPVGPTGPTRPKRG